MTRPARSPPTRLNPGHRGRPRDRGVEPGVERIISDGAGHDLDEGHPDFRYDMDDVAIMPDGTIWLWSSYRETDKRRQPADRVWCS